MLIFGLIAASMPLAMPDRLETAYRRSLGRIERARSIYVQVDDAISKQVREYWLQKPNRMRIVVDGIPVRISDGKTRFGHKDGNWAKTKMGARFDGDIELFGFEPFFKKGDAPGEYFGAGEFRFKGKNYPSVNVKTTESAIFYGMTYFDRKTLLPIGHSLTEYADTTVDVRYLKVVLNPKISKDTFRAPG